MRKTILSVFLSLFVFVAFAQEQRQRATPEQMVERQVKTLTEKLALTAEQQEKIKTLSMARAEKMQEARQTRNQQQSDQIKQREQEYESELNKVLTAEQKTKYEEYKKERMQNRGDGRRQGPRSEKAPRQ